MTQRQLQEARNEQRLMHEKLYKRLVNFIIGPKYDGKYSIEFMKKNGSKDKIIRIYRGYDCPNIYIYFGNKLRIASSLMTFDKHKIYDVFYDYYNEFDTGLLPNNIDEYIDITYKFLVGFITHSKCVQPDNFHIYTCYNEVPLKFIDNAPESLKSVISKYENVLSYEWSYSRLDEILYMCDVLSSNEYKRARGDYKQI